MAHSFIHHLEWEFSSAMLLVLVSLAVGVLAVDPVVELNTGGLLGGKEITYNGQQVQLFLGVPYAEAPVGENRFAKPKQFPAWKGVRQAKTLGNSCLQVNLLTGGVMGNEDCLFLDITVPGAIDPSAKKPVMVWIHGGGYTSGSKDAYLGAGLAVKGDVIVVAINYRLGVLGFLSDGNFGLWDQRAALLWVKENIENFGGDPDLVTIFGESAGAGSVSAQMMGQHNDGLFKRAIQQSGSLYTPWGWYLSERQRYEFLQRISTDFNCSSTETLYECLRKASVEDLFTKVKGRIPQINYFQPSPDGDFFATNVTDESYDLATRFDLLAGFNGQEGLLALPELIRTYQKVSWQNGTSVDTVKQILNNSVCSTTTPLSVQLCADYLLDAYQLALAPHDTQRVIELSHMYTDLYFSLDMVHQLSEHGKGSRSTFAYYFTELEIERVRLWDVPDWTRISADHADEIVYVFGAPYLDEEDIWTGYFGEGWEKNLELNLIVGFLNSSHSFDKSVSDLMMTAWTNFARSGNPNQPAELPDEAPEWPQFNRDTSQFIEFNSAKTQVITTPNKERLKDVYDAIYPARRQQVLADVAPGKSCGHKEEKVKDSSATSAEISLAACLMACLFHLTRGSM